MAMTLDFYREIALRLKAVQVIALATVVETKGSTPRESGAKMLVTANGSTIGTVGGGYAEVETMKAASEAIRTGVPRLLHVELTADEAARSGAICGGTMDIFIDLLKPSDS